MKKSFLIGVAGMPGAGKATVIEVAERLGYGAFAMGDEVRKETKQRGLDLTLRNVGEVMIDIRREEGPSAVAKRSIDKILQMKHDVIIVDGIRSLSEVEEFKKHFASFRLLAIHASPKTRFKRLNMRKRKDDVPVWEKFLERDRRELKVGLGNVIASADLMIVNDGEKAAFNTEVTDLLEGFAHWTM